jgi:hypothetical protein
VPTLTHDERSSTQVSHAYGATFQAGGASLDAAASFRPLRWLSGGCGVAGRAVLPRRGGSQAVVGELDAMDHAAVSTESLRAVQRPVGGLNETFARLSV